MKIKTLKINKIYTNKYDFIKEIILKQLKLEKDIYDKFVEREKISPTLLEYGIALPHIVYDNIPEEIVYVISKYPIFWGIKHADSVNKIIFIMAKDRKRLNEILSKLALFIERRKGRIDEKNIYEIIF